MKTILLLLISCLATVQALAQHQLPSQLLGNWLLPQNNEWKYGFQLQYAIADGDFWQYEVVKLKKNNLEVLLKNAEKQQKLFITFDKDNNVKIGSSKKTAVTLTQQRNEQPDYAHYDQTGFRLPLIQSGTFHLRGVINGYDKKKDNYKYATVIYNHLFEKKQRNYVTEVDSLGRFDIKFPLMNPQEIMFKFGNKLEGFYAVPGSSVLMYINSNGSSPSSTEAYLASLKMRDDIYFMGPEGMLNTEINDYAHNLTRLLDFQEDSEQVKKLDQDAYKNFRMGKMQEQLQHVKAYAQQHRSGRRFEQQLEQRIKYSAAEDLLRYSWLKDIKTRVPLTEEYLAFTKEIPVNNETAVITQHYGDFVQEVAKVAFAGVAPIEQSLNLAEVIDGAKAAGFMFNPEEEALLRATATPDNNLKEADIAKINALAKKYSDAMNAGANRVFSRLQAERSLESLARLGVNPAGGIASSILTAHLASEFVAKNQLLTPPELAQYRKAIEYPVLFEAIETLNSNLQKVLTGAMPAEANIISGLKSAQDKILDSLLSKYAGKIVYIDFWAPWCGPCIGEMPNSKKLKQELAGKNIVFLYLGVECSNESWQRAIKTNAIEGEHYLLNKNEYALLSERFQIGGIPRYMLIDKAGKVADANAKRPSQKTALLQDIQLLLDK